MAEKTEIAMTVEEKIIQAKELYGRGRRNYLVKSYYEAADDLSRVCSMYADIYGSNSDELGMPYLLYAKCLIALAQDENNVFDVPEEGSDEDDEGNDEDDDNNEENPEIDNEADAAVASSSSMISTTTTPLASPKQNIANNVDKKSVEGADNKINNDDDKKCTVAKNLDDPCSSSSAAAAATSSCTSNGHSNDKLKNDVVEEGEGTTAEEDNDGSVAANLQIAWEALEFAVQIFERQGEASLPNLADAYTELAEISFENGHFEVAIKDFRIGLDIHMKLPDDNLRIIAEIQYKIGLCYLMLSSFEESITAFRKACEILDNEIESQKSKEHQDEKIKNIILEIEETKQEILNKITEVEETKHQSVEEVKKELAKLMCTNEMSFANDVLAVGTAGPSSSSVSSSSSAFSSSINTTKPTDISHLIKRKKPDTQPDKSDEAPAKRPAI